MKFLNYLQSSGTNCRIAFHNFPGRVTRTASTRCRHPGRQCLIRTLVTHFVLGTLLSFASVMSAQTLVSGNISGTWTPAGNPYVAVDNCEVPSGQTLNIGPGVVVIIGSNLNVTVHGTIQAVGTANDRVTIRGASATVPYGNIHVNYSTDRSRFEFCDFANAERALWFDITNYTDVPEATFSPLVGNCTFSNIWRTAVLSRAIGTVHSAQWPGDSFFAMEKYIDPVIVNCVFSSCYFGCVFVTAGSYFYQPYLEIYAHGYASPRVANNVFLNITNVAVYFYPETYSGNSTPLVMNNDCFSSTYGIVTTDPFNVTVKNNIFAGNVTAVLRTGTLSGTVGLNCFFQNQTNFTGYPGSFGQIVMNNRNGTPCDVAYNIFEDPSFVASNDFHLATNSPCIDAGTSDWAFTDTCFPPSQGNSYTDLGAYGGPDACNWLEVVPIFPVQIWMSQSNDVVRFNWGAIPRSAYQIYWISNLVSTGTNEWLTSTNHRVVPDEKLFSGQVNTSLPQRFFRIESLGGPASQ